MAQRAHAQPSEDVQVVERLVLGLTAVVCLQVGVMFAVAGESLAVIALPGLLVLALLARGSIVPAAYVGAAGWTLLMPHAPGVALMVPFALSVGCLAIAIGPERLMDWVGEDFGGRARPGDDASGWFEDDPRA